MIFPTILPLFSDAACSDTGKQVQTHEMPPFLLYRGCTLSTNYRVILYNVPGREREGEKEKGEVRMANEIIGMFGLKRTKIDALP